MCHSLAWLCLNLDYLIKLLYHASLSCVAIYGLVSLRVCGTLTGPAFELTEVVI